MYVIGADGAEAGQNLCKGSDNKILMLPANKYSFVIKFCLRMNWEFGIYILENSEWISWITQIYICMKLCKGSDNKILMLPVNKYIFVIKVLIDLCLLGIQNESLLDHVNHSNKILMLPMHT